MYIYIRSQNIFSSYFNKTNLLIVEFPFPTSEVNKPPYHVPSHNNVKILWNNLTSLLQKRGYWFQTYRRPVPRSKRRSKQNLFSTGFRMSHRYPPVSSCLFDVIYKTNYMLCGVFFVGVEFWRVWSFLNRLCRKPGDSQSTNLFKRYTKSTSKTLSESVQEEYPYSNSNKFSQTLTV